MTKKGNQNGWLTSNRDNILTTLIAGLLAAAILAGISAGVSATREGLLVEFLGGVSEKNLATRFPFPAKTVVAFDSDECPRGWSRLKEAEGRTIVGAGRLRVAGTDLQLYEYRHTGGEREVTLTEDHLPSHKHAYDDVYYAEDASRKTRLESVGVHSVNVPAKVGSKGGWDDNNFGWVRPDTMTESSGLEVPNPLDNMQPYVVLSYCKPD